MIRKLNLFFSIFTLVIFSSSTIAADKVVTFLHGETDTESVVAYEKIARDFEKLNPGIKIEISTVSSKDRLKKVTAMGMARNLPTVFKLNPEERMILTLIKLVEYTKTGPATFDIIWTLIIVRELAPLALAAST